MIDYILRSLSDRYLNEKGRRLLFLSSLYVLLCEKNGTEPDVEKFNVVMSVNNSRSIMLAMMFYQKILGCRFTEFTRNADSKRVLRYSRLAYPRWLSYKRSTDYCFETDVLTLSSIAKQ